jgi:hypothetical protein
MTTNTVRKYAFKVNARISKEVAKATAKMQRDNLRLQGYLATMLWSDHYQEYLVLFKRGVDYA